ncbi:MAG TPA: hypothetical protein VME67_13040 [Mycobacterium sp.]|nr:hypothetical protein [Mycobacterium sp.]
MTDQELLAPLTKNLNRIPLSRQKSAKTPTTCTLAPSSMISANRLSSPGSRVSTPTGAALSGSEILG